MTVTKKRNRRIMIAVMAAVSSVAIIVPMISALLGLFGSNKLGADGPITPTSTTPALTIKPLSVRPVVSAFVTTPDQCPTPPPTPAEQPLRICDITKTAVYELKPEAMRVQLTRVDSFRNPLDGIETV